MLAALSTAINPEPSRFSRAGSGCPISPIIAPTGAAWTAPKLRGDETDGDDGDPLAQRSAAMGERPVPGGRLGGAVDRRHRRLRAVLWRADAQPQQHRRGFQIP